MIQLWCDVWKRYFGILGSDKGGLSGSYLFHLMPFAAAHLPLRVIFQGRKSHTLTHTHLFGTTKAHSYTNTAKSLTFTLLSVLRHRKTRLTCDTRERALRVCACSPGARGGQRTLINIWWETMRTSETAKAGKSFSLQPRTKDSRQEQKQKESICF